MQDMITTQRLVLRPYRAADAEVLLAGFNDFAVVKWLANPPYPFKRTDVRLTRADGSSRWPDVGAIDHDGQMIGSISRVPHFGFWILRAFWGRGFATEAGRAMIADVFRTTPQIELASGYFEGNAASAHVLTKLGFREVKRAVQRCQPQQKDLPFVGLTLNRHDWETAPC
ncbi:MAG: GNAT family N-acetyltransferase [Pseudomonadota bacterium]